MEKRKKRKISWTKAKCKKEALKYEFKHEFFNKSNSVYTASIRNGWYKEISKHLKNKTRPLLLDLTIEECKEEALKYNTRKEFAINCYRSYETSRLNGWLNDVCSHMLELVKPRGYWDVFENCKNEALKYKTRNEFSVNCNRAYKMCLKFGWLDDVSSHMIDAMKIAVEKRRIWTKEKCKNEALKYRIKSRMNPSALGSIHKNGWEDELCSHMEKPHENYKKMFHWTKEKTHEEALKYNLLYDFKKANGSAYNAAYKNKWLDVVCSHMNKPYGKFKKKNYWSKEKCHKEALKYNKRSLLYYSNSTVYQKARLKGWLDDICSHMTPKK